MTMQLRRVPALFGVLAATLVLVLSGCGSSAPEAADEPAVPSTSPTSGPVESETATTPATGDPTGDPTGEPTGEPTSEPPTSTDPGVIADADPETIAFCEALNAAPAKLNPDPQKAAKQIRAYGAGLAAVDAPEILADDAVDGLEVLIEFFGAIRPGQVNKFVNAASPEDVLGEKDGALVNEFFTETAQLCATSMPTAPPS